VSSKGTMVLEETLAARLIVSGALKFHQPLNLKPLESWDQTFVNLTPPCSLMNVSSKET